MGSISSPKYRNITRLLVDNSSDLSRNWNISQPRPWTMMLGRQTTFLLGLGLFSGAMLNSSRGCTPKNGVTYHWPRQKTGRPDLNIEIHERDPNSSCRYCSCIRNASLPRANEQVRGRRGILICRDFFVESLENVNRNIQITVLKY